MAPVAIGAPVVNISPIDLLNGFNNKDGDEDGEETFKMPDIYGKRKKKVKDEDLIMSEDDSCNEEISNQ